MAAQRALEVHVQLLASTIAAHQTHHTCPQVRRLETFAPPLFGCCACCLVIIDCTHALIHMRCVSAVWCTDASKRQEGSMSMCCFRSQVKSPIASLLRICVTSSFLLGRPSTALHSTAVASFSSANSLMHNTSMSKRLRSRKCTINRNNSS
jgi:hypothetical protein